MTLYDFALSSTGGVATAGSTQAGYSPTEAIDGSDVTFWRCQAYAANPWWKVDTGGLRYIEEVHWIGHAGSGVYALYLEYSTNDVDWLYLAENISTAETTLPTGGITARYWRIRATGIGAGEWFGLYTVNVRGPVTAPPTPPIPVYAVFDEFMSAVLDNVGSVVDEWLPLNGIPEYTPMDALLLAMMYYLAQQYTVPELTVEAGASLEDIQTALDVLEGNVNANTTADITNLHTAIDTDFTNQADAMGTAISIAEGNIEAAVTAEHVVTNAKIDALGAPDLQPVLDAITTHDGYSNGRRDAILAAIAAMAAVLGAFNVGETLRGIIDGIGTALTAARGVIDATKTVVDGQATDLSEVLAKEDDILDAIANIPTAQAIDWRYPGPSGCTLSTPVPFTSSVRITAAEHGVSGRIDGVLIQLTSVPSGSSLQVVEDVENVKYAGWLVFQDAGGRVDRQQWIGPKEAAYTPVQFRDPAAVVVYTKHGSTGVITAWALPTS